MKTRFEGQDGKRRLVEVMQEQHLVKHDPQLAGRIAADGELIEFSAGDFVIRQGSADNDIYFIVDGEVAVEVNGRFVATRRPRDSIGEMALVDGAARRSATVVASKPMCAVKLTEPQFQKVAEEYPRIWRAVAIVVAERLRQRNEFHRAPNTKPILFIGSSVEGLPVAKQIQLGLKHANVVPQLWTNGIFGPGGLPIDSLLEHVERSDFAIFVFGPDDTVTSRNVEYAAPRDNVVFELGLYMGKLNRDRCYIVKKHGSDIKIPSDLLGVTAITYVQALDADISMVCTQIEDAVGRLGVK